MQFSITLVIQHLCFLTALVQGLSFSLHIEKKKANSELIQQVRLKEGTQRVYNYNFV